MIHHAVGLYYLARRLWRRWRNPRLKRVLVHVTYKDYKEQYKRLQVKGSYLTRIRDMVFDNDNVRAIRIYEELFYGHKTFTEDMDVDLDELLSVLKSDPKIAEINKPDYPRTIVASAMPIEDIDNAPYPHCDSDVLHAPGECEFCDHYPDRQNERAVAGINFTGHSDPDKSKCPSEMRRSLDTIERWPGNRASKPQ